MSTNGAGLWRRLLPWILMTLPAWIYLVHLPDFGRMQYNDYYTSIYRLTDNGRLTTSPVRYLTFKQNEHNVAIPVVLYVANIWLTDGDNRGLSVFALVFMLVELVLLVRLLPECLTRRSWLKVVVGAFLCAFVFTPVAAHNVVMGFSGTIWFLSNAFTVAALWAVMRAAQARESRVWWWLPACFGLLGALSYSTNLSLWPGLVLTALVVGSQRRTLIAIAASAIVAFAFFSWTYENPVFHPEPELHSIGTVLSYLGSYMGALFSADVSLAAPLGWLTLALLVALAGAVVASRSRTDLGQLVPWLALAIYGVANGVGTAIGRSGFGQSQSLASRYASLPALLVMAAAVALGMVLVAERTRRSALARVGIAVFVLVLVGATATMYIRGLPVLDKHLDKAARQPLAELAARYGIADPVAESIVVPWPTAFFRVADTLRAWEHVPYDRPPDPEYGTVLDLRTTSTIAGGMAVEDRLAEGVIRVGGWLDRPAEEILLVNGNGVVRGKGFPGFEPGRGWRKVPATGSEAGWVGYARQVPGEQLRAVARLPRAGLAKIDCQPLAP